MKIEGLYTALVTPVTDHGINKKAMGKLMDHVLEGGSDGLVVLGGTGEYGALSAEQRIAAAEFCVEETAGRAPVVVGILAPGLQDAVEMGKRSRQLGADAVMLVTPYYVVADHNGLVEYHLKFMDAVDLPILLYNIPYRTLVNIRPETVVEIVDRADGQVVGIKECSPDLSQVSRLISMIGDRIPVICGEESLFFAETIMGAKGGILASANLVPGFWSEMMHALRRGDISKAKKMHMEIQPFIAALFAEANPGPLKAALKYSGIDCGDPLLPLHPPRDDAAATLQEELKRIKKWLR